MEKKKKKKKIYTTVAVASGLMGIGERTHGYKTQREIKDGNNGEYKNVVIQLR